MATKEIGSHCIWIYNGKEWPVVLCDNDTPPQVFMTGRRMDVMEMPAILLGRRKYIWVIDDDRLRDYDPHRDYLEGLPHFDTLDIHPSDDSETQMEKQRRVAFKQDVEEWASPQFWKNMIDRQRKAREAEREIAAKGKRKRKHRDEYDDIEVISVRRSLIRSSSSRAPNKRSNSGTGTGTSAGAESGQLPTPGPTPVKSKVGSSSGQSIRIEDDEIDDGSDDGDLFVGPAKPQGDLFTACRLQRLRERHGLSVKSNPPSDDVYTIFVGDAKTPFQVPKHAVSKCDFFTNQLHSNEQLRSHIDLSACSDVTAKEFVPIYEYMHNGDFAPPLIALDGDSQARISKQKDKLAERCAYVFRTASQLQLADLQLLAVNKLKALYPLSPLVILIVTRIAQGSESWGCDAEGELFAWLADHIADYFYKLMAHHGSQLLEVLSNSRGLDQTVADRVADNPKGCRKGLD